MSGGTENTGTIYLVGAGPGDPGLLTCRAVEVLRRADVVFYDRLVDEGLLAHARDAELVSVGKRPDHHTMPQETINEQLVQRARAGMRVVRLKGGDPFVFGRGGEEAIAARAAGVRFEVVPGVSSAFAAPAYAGVPVTHRGLSAAVTVVTGHEELGHPESRIDWAHLAAGRETLVIMMGMGRLTGIARNLLENGRSAETPVAVIENGTQPSQRSLVTSLGALAERVAAEGYSSPAIVVVGEVAALGKRLGWLPQRPLAGRRIVVTRAGEQAGELSRMLRDCGAQPVELPTIRILPPEDYGPLDAALTEITAYNAIVFTSVNGVSAFFNRLAAQHAKDTRSLAGAEIWAIGPKTAEALARYGVVADLVPPEFRAEALLEACAGRDIAGWRILLPRADIARVELYEGLAARGARVDRVTAYRTAAADLDREALRSLLEKGRIDALTFTSASTARNFADRLTDEEIERARGSLVIASIGPVTSRAAREVGLPPAVEATEYTLEGLVAVLVEYFQKAQERSMTAARPTERPETRQNGDAAHD